MQARRKATSATSKERIRVPAERAQFLQLLAAQPNYFGNAPAWKTEPVKVVAAETSYEELTCVSYQPERSLLEATVQIKLAYGFSGDLCQAGSREYVRFYVDSGAGFVDAGVVGIEVHDIVEGSDCAGEPTLPLSYAAAVAYDPARFACSTPLLPRVRAILSWQVVPPANDPNWTPVWGNVEECNIQISPRLPVLIDLVSEISKLAGVAKLAIPPQYAEVPQLPIPLPDPPPLSLGELVTLYSVRAGKTEVAHARVDSKAALVPAHRFGHANLQHVLAAVNPSPLLITQKNAEWAALGLDYPSVVAASQQTSADTTYEELECLGLDNNTDRLTATFRVKLPNGYSGGLCSAGSTEYVAFWADWGDTCEWTYLATVAVKAHDIAQLPPGGLCYAAVLPVDLSSVRKPCPQPVVGRVRAVLSWNAAPSTTDADALGTWGNRLDAHVQVRPGAPISAPAPLIGVLGGIPVSMIDSISGLTKPNAIFALTQIAPDSSGRPCPFGGRVVVQGPSFPGQQYRVQVRRVGELAWTTLTTPLTLVDWTGTVFTTSAPDPNTGYFTYQPFQLNVDNVLAVWDTTGDDLWDVQLDIQGVAGVDTHRMQLDNTAPEVAIDISNLGGNCGKFPVGTLLQGTFVARDAYLGAYSLGTAPFAGPVVPSGGSVQTPPSPGAAWSLNTTNMQPCGYIVSVSVVDRAIVNSGSVGHWVSASAGFCLE